MEDRPKKCNICGGKVAYQKNSKMKSGWCYRCESCGAMVGTYPKRPTVALGTLADTETRKKRIEVHKLLDRFWRGSATRDKLYEKLATELGIEKENCHFAYMDLEMLNKAEQILLRWWREKYDI